jgi:nitrous oxidase accessory protein NosD
MDKKYGILIICAVTLLLCFVGGASAKTWYVDDSGGADFTGIQEAIIAASAGDTIIVSDGDYIENIIVNKRLTIRSENGADSIRILAGDEKDPIFYASTSRVQATTTYRITIALTIVIMASTFIYQTKTAY